MAGLKHGVEDDQDFTHTRGDGDVMMFTGLGEALVRNGVETLEALLKKDFEQLNVIFQSAQTDGLIVSVPDAAAILEFSRDAALVFHGGHCMGAVLAPDGTPLHDAAVVVGGLTTSTDERGRYCLIRIPPAAGHTLKIEYAGYATLYEPHFAVDYDSRAVRVQYWTLDAAPVPAPVPEFDEYNGADLPALSCYRTVLRSFQQEDMREGDVLKVHELYASTPHVKLVSIFRACQAGDLVVRYVIDCCINNAIMSTSPGGGIHHATEGFCGGTGATPAPSLGVAGSGAFAQ